MHGRGETAAWLAPIAAAAVVVTVPVLVAVLVFVVGRAKRLRQGSIFWAYLAGYGFVRFWVELLRTDTTFRLLGLSRNNWIALLVFAAGLAGGGTGGAAGGRPFPVRLRGRAPPAPRLAAPAERVFVI